MVALDIDKSLTCMREWTMISRWFFCKDIHLLVIGFIMIEETQWCPPQPRQHARGTLLQFLILGGCINFIGNGFTQKAVISGKPSFVPSCIWVFLNYPRTKNVEECQYRHQAWHGLKVPVTNLDINWAKNPCIKTVLVVCHTILPEFTVLVVSRHVAMWLCLSEPVAFRN